MAAMCPEPAPESAVKIREMCDSIKEMLLAKNASYGDSALHPASIFCHLDPVERLRVRIDDKLNRLAKGHEFQGDDTIRDLAGYLILLLIAREEDRALKEPLVISSQPPSGPPGKFEAPEWTLGLWEMLSKSAAFSWVSQDIRLEPTIHEDNIDVFVEVRLPWESNGPPHSLSCRVPRSELILRREERTQSLRNALWRLTQSVSKRPGGPNATQE